jgi:hypothetical protein
MGMMRSNMATLWSKRDYREYGWMVLSANAVLGILAALIICLPSLSMLANPVYRDTYLVVGALGTALVGFNVLALILILVPFKRHDRWAWYTLWILPLQWLSQFAFFPDLTYLTLALLTAVGLILPYRSFFPREEPARVE